MAAENLQKKNAVVGIRVDTTRIFINRTFMHDPFCCEAKRCAPQAQDKHESVRVTTTDRLVLQGSNVLVDGVKVQTGDRVLVRFQKFSEENGIYVVEEGAWARSQDADGPGDLRHGSYVFVEQGSTGTGLSFQLTTPDPVTLGVSGIFWEEFKPQTVYGSVSDEELVTDRVANSLYENSNQVQFLLDPKYFFEQFPHPVSWKYKLTKKFTATDPPNLFRDAIFNPYGLPGILVPDTITLLAEDGTDEKVGSIFASRYRDGREVVLRYWPAPTEPDFVFLDRLQLPANEEESGVQLPDGICGLPYKWVFNHNRNHHDIHFTTIDANIPPGTSLSSQGLLLVDQLPDEPGEWHLVLRARDTVKNKEAILRFDFRCRARDSATTEGSGPLALEMAPYASGDCVGLRLHLGFEVNYQYNATRVLKVSGGSPPYRFNFHNEKDLLLRPPEFHDPGNQNPDWFGMWYFEANTDPDSDEPLLPDLRDKITDFTGFDINSYKKGEDAQGPDNRMREITESTELPGLFHFQQINETTVLFLMHIRGFYQYGFSEKDNRLRDLWLNLPLKLRVMDSAGATASIDIHISNCTAVYEKMWTLDQTYYEQDEGTGAIAGEAMVFGGEVLDIPVEYGGREYTSPPGVLITGGGGSGATASAVVAGGQVVGLVVTNPGQGYTEPPSVAIEESEGDIRRVTRRELISAYGILRFDGSDRPGLAHKLLSYNSCGYGASPRVVNT